MWISKEMQSWLLLSTLAVEVLELWYINPGSTAVDPFSPFNLHLALCVSHTLMLNVECKDSPSDTIKWVNSKRAQMICLNSLHFFLPPMNPCPEVFQHGKTNCPSAFWPPPHSPGDCIKMNISYQPSLGNTVVSFIHKQFFLGCLRPLR